ncbi:IclR family transcriptional regulator [Noviherbaspirillum sp.]|uniref:IclR family transcriptional regulator n=1 Tax=Noviherbaspirillum sp. TaxID=1926288 RepID=UPI0025DDB335|nr:IclR family transcriptional regulator [Noviherbaspirillum sp.]
MTPDSAASLMKADDVTAGQAAPSHPQPEDKEDRAFVVALARGLDVLTCFSAGDDILTNTEIARRCKLSKSNIAHLTHTLAQLGYLTHDENYPGYRLGTATIALGSATLTQLDIRRMAMPLMKELAEFAHADVSLAVRERLSMFCIQTCRSHAALTLGLDIGSRIPMAKSAMGRACLAMMPQAEREELQERLREAEEMHWPEIVAAIDAAAVEFRESGCCVSLGEWHGANEIAAAFSPGDRLPIVAVGVGGSAHNLTPDFLRNEIRPRLLELVRRLTYPLRGAARF